jgi:DNA-binding MarR family transcriptional regulator
MSARCTIWAWTQAEQRRDLSPTQLLTLLAMADQARDNGKTWASAEFFARKTGFSEKTIRTATKDLVDKGLVSVEPRPGLAPIIWLVLTRVVIFETPEGGSEVRGLEARRTPEPDDATPEPLSRTPVTGSDDPRDNPIGTILTDASVREAGGEALADQASAPGIVVLRDLLACLKADPPCTAEEVLDGVRAAAAWHLGRDGPRSMRTWTLAARKAYEFRDTRLRGGPTPTLEGRTNDQSAGNYRAQGVAAPAGRPQGGRRGSATFVDIIARRRAAAGHADDVS